MKPFSSIPRPQLNFIKALGHRNDPAQTTDKRSESRRRPEGLSKLRIYIFKMQTLIIRLLPGPKTAKVLVRVIQHWWLELIAVALVSMSFSGLIAVLHDYQGCPLPQWPLGFSFNAALSVLGLLFRAPTLFITGQGLGQLKWHWLSRRRPLSDLTTYDEASRGPWGSAKLLWTAPCRDILTFLGASITLVTLGMDPFTQAVVSYYDCSANDRGATSGIGRINYYFSQRTGYELQTPARVAVDAGFLDANSIMPNFTCSTDTCTFSDSYHSIGLCSECLDVTDELIIDCEPGRTTGWCQYTLSRPYLKWVDNVTASYKNVDARDETDPNATYAEWQVFAVRKYYGSVHPNGSIVSAGSEGIPSYQSSTIHLVSALPILGVRCSIRYCVRSYTATIDHGVLNEQLQSTSNNWSQHTDVAPVIGTVNVNCLTPPVRSRLLNDGYTSPSTEWMAWNGTYLKGTENEEQISPSHNLSIPARCAYQAQMPSEPDEFFSDSLNGDLNGTGWNNQIGLQPGGSSVLLWLYRDGAISIDSISEAIENFTRTSSNYLRTLYNPIPDNISSLSESNRYKGLPLTAVHSGQEEWNDAAIGLPLMATTCIHVRWPWLSLPATIFLATLVFIAALIVQNLHDSGIEVWKSSQNALLWHGIDGPAVAESVNLETANDMTRRAKAITVHLGKTRMGWKLVQD